MFEQFYPANDESMEIIQLILEETAIVCNEIFSNRTMIPLNHILINELQQAVNDVYYKTIMNFGIVPIAFDKDQNLYELKGLVIRKDEYYQGRLKIDFVWKSVYDSKKSIEDIYKYEILRKKERKEKLKKHVVKTLRRVASYIENEEYDKVREMVEFSMSGDGYGQNNYYINFSTADEPMDIIDVIHLLEEFDN